MISTPFLLSLLVTTGCAAPASTERSEVYVDESAASAGSTKNAAGQSATVVPADELSEPELHAADIQAADTSSSASTGSSSSTGIMSSETSGDVVDADTEESQVNETGESSDTYEADPDGEEQTDRVDIVFLGDSQFASERGTWSAISEIVRDVVGVDECEVYNLGIGGTAASLDTYERGMTYDNWISPCFVGMAHLIHGDITADFLEESHPEVAAIWKNIDIDSIDYFVVDYGVNDFLDGSDIYIEDDFSQHDDYADFSPAYQYSLQMLNDACPNAKIIICTPCYAQFYGKDGAYLGDGNTLSNGVGTLSEYVANTYYCASQARNVIYLNMYDGSRIDLDAYSAADYLIDGIHLTTAGRRAYGTAVGRVINRDRGVPEEEYRVIKIDEFS